MSKSLTAMALLLLAIAACPCAAGETDFEKLSQVCEDIESLHQQQRTTLRRASEITRTMLELQARMRNAARKAGDIQAVGLQQQAETASDLSLVQAVTAQANGSRRRGEMRRMRNATQVVAQREYLIEVTRLIQLRYARDVTNESLRTMAQEFVRLGRELSDLQTSASEIAANYLSKADIYAAKSRMENLAVLLALEKAEPDNVAAHLAQAITLGRLNRFEAAQNLLDHLPPAHPLSPVSRAIKIAIAASAGNEVDVLREFKPLEESTAQFPIIRVLATRAKLATGQFVAATHDMIATLKADSHDVFVHRDLALVFAANAARSRQAGKKAIAYAKIASMLTNGSEWSVELAYAIALSSDQQFDAAKLRAEAASELARDNAIALCDSVLLSIEDKRQPDWDFQTF